MLNFIVWKNETKIYQSSLRIKMAGILVKLSKLRESIKFTTALPFRYMRYTFSLKSRVITFFFIMRTKGTLLTKWNFFFFVITYLLLEWTSKFSFKANSYQTPFTHPLGSLKRFLKFLLDTKKKGPANMDEKEMLTGLRETIPSLITVCCQLWLFL